MNKPATYFDLSDVWFADLFDGVENVWDVLKPNFKEAWIERKINRNIDKINKNGSFVTENTNISVENGTYTIEYGAFLVGNDIQVGKDVIIEGGAWVSGPTILGEGTIIRHGAYVRGGVITGKNAIIGHTSEVKSSILMNHAKAPHFAYVGDSILGNGVNLGAGTKVSNLKITNDEIVLRLGEKTVHTGLRKMGAIIGDNTETGCNSVLNPGVLLGKGCLVYPAVAVKKAYYKAKTVVR